MQISNELFGQPNKPEQIGGLKNKLISHSSGGWEVQDQDADKVGAPEKLVKRALRKMFKGKKADMPGVINHLATPLLKHTPDWLVFLAIKYVGRFQK